MRQKARLKRIEEKILGNEQIWAVFSLSDYSDPSERKFAQNKLIEAYVNQGNPYPTHRIFLNEVPCSGFHCKEKFLSSFWSKGS